MKTQLIAILTLSSTAMAYPAAAWLDGDSASQAPVASAPSTPEAETPGVEENEPAPQQAAVEKPTEIVVPEMVIVAQSPRKAARAKKTALATPATQPKPTRTCTTHQSQMVSGGAVVVCDVMRTANGRSASPFAASHTFERLAARDLPSPTGLLRAGEEE